MAIKIVPFEAVHLSMVRTQQSQLNTLPYFRPEYAKALEQTQSYTAIDGGEVVACGGLGEVWPGRAMAWSLLSENIGRRILGVTRAARALIDTSPYQRVEIEVAVDFEQGHRWAKMLGFQLEAPVMRKVLLDGSDASLYAKVK
jgi:hypothetical protein